MDSESPRTFAGQVRISRRIAIIKVLKISKGLFVGHFGYRAPLGPSPSTTFFHAHDEVNMNITSTSTPTTVEGAWNHLGLGSGLGRESDGMMWYSMRISDYDRLRYRERVRPSTATTAGVKSCTDSPASPTKSVSTPVPALAPHLSHMVLLSMVQSSLIRPSVSPH